MTAATPYPDRVGGLDRLDLMHVMLGHPDLPLRVEIGTRLVDVRDFRYSPEQGAVVLLLKPGRRSGSAG